MEKKTNIVETRCRDLYFLYLDKVSDKGMTNRTWHMHTFYEIMFFADGSSEYAIENNRYVIKKGDVLLIKPGYHHFERRVIEPSASFYCLGFSAELIANGELAKNIFERKEHFFVGAEHPLSQILKAAKGLIEISPDNISLLLKSIAETAILALSDPALSESDAAERGNRNLDKILRFINENLFDIKTVDDITRGVFFSNSYLRSTFKREMGIGVMQYVRNKKLLIANDRIKKGEKPTLVYTKCGFLNYPSFYRAYVSYFGHAPKITKKLLKTEDV